MKSTGLQPQDTSPYYFLRGGGVMGAAMRAHDWESDAFGSPELWHPTLKTTVSILLNSKFPMVVFWGDENLCFYNDAYIPSLDERKHPAALGQPGEAIWPEAWPQVKAMITEVKTSREGIFREDLLVPIERDRKIQDTYWIFSYSPLIDENDRVCGVLSVCMETTSGVVRQQELKESRDLLEFSINAADLGTWDLDPATNKFTSNARLKEIFGISEEETDLAEAINNVSDVDQASLRKAIAEALNFESGGAFDTSYGVKNPATGKETIARAVGKVSFDENKNPVRFNGVMMDVTTEALAQREMLLNEARFRHMVMASPFAIAIFRGENFIIELANGVMADVLWRKKIEDVQGKSLFEVFPELQGQEYPALLKQVYDTGIKHTDSEAVAFVEGDDGLKKFYLDYEYQPLLDLQGKVNGLLATVNDVSDKVLARKRIQEGDERTRMIVEASKLGTYEINLQTGEWITNPKLFDIYGVAQGSSRDVLVSTLHPEDLSIREDAYQKAFETGDLEYESRVIWQDGSLHWIKVIGRVIKDENGKPLTQLGTAQDITDQKLFAEELSRLVKERTMELEVKNKELERSNANLEDFAYAASHDMKEPIRKIRFFADRVKEAVEGKLEGEQLRYFDRLEVAAKRMGMLIDDLLTYSRVNTEETLHNPIDLNETIAQVLHDLELEVDQKNADIQVDPLPVILGHPRQIQQAFQNLLSNALKFVKPGIQPLITVTAEETLAFHIITVKDNGIGFEQASANRIFDVFTRLHGQAEFKGTGLGLSIVRKVMDNHKGEIRVTSSPGNGASFKLFFPITHF